MNKYFTFFDWVSLLQKLGKEKQKILFSQTLQTASGLSHVAALKAIQRLNERGYLLKIYKRIYANKFSLPSLEEVAMFYGKPCYISFESALENYGIISQSPMMLTCATTKKIRNLKTPFGEIIFHHIKTDLFNNYKNEGGILWATAEKALLDFLYINMKTKKYCPALDELDLSILNKKRLKIIVENFPQSVKNYCLKQLIFRTK